jgi:hypothetical protein
MWFRWGAPLSGYGYKVCLSLFAQAVHRLCRLNSLHRLCTACAETAEVGSARIGYAVAIHLVVYDVKLRVKDAQNLTFRRNIYGSTTTSRHL